MNSAALSDVSVIIPTYNRLRYLKDAIASVEAQTVAVREIIVVDDGSSDGTREYAAELAPRVCYLRQANAGPSAARNRGLRAARGEWIALLDSDDQWVPDRLARQAELLARQPNLDFVFGTQVNSRHGFTDAQPEILNANLYRRLQEQASGIRDFFDLLLVLNPVPTSSVLFRRSCLARVGYFDESRWRCEDYELWFRFAAHCSVGFTDHPLIVKRSQDDNLINDYRKLWEAHLAVLLSLPETHPIRRLPQHQPWKQAVAQTHYRLGSFALSRGEFDLAEPHFRAFRERDLPPPGADRLRSLLKRVLLASGCGRLAIRRRPSRHSPVQR